MTEPSIKSEVRCYEKDCGRAEGHWIHHPGTKGPVSNESHPFLDPPQPPVSAPEKCPKCGLAITECMRHDSAQPTPSEGPYRYDANARLVGGPGVNEGKAAYGHLAKLLNIAFAQGQASSAKEIEAFVTLVKTGRVKMDELIAERDQLKARWDDLRAILEEEGNGGRACRSWVLGKMDSLDRSRLE